LDQGRPSFIFWQSCPPPETDVQQETVTVHIPLLLLLQLVGLRLAAAAAGAAAAVTLDTPLKNFVHVGNLTGSTYACPIALASTGTSGSELWMARMASWYSQAPAEQHHHHG
jgi:hypothetical protein